MAPGKFIPSGPGTYASAPDSVPLAVHLRTLESKNRERDDAYACGYDAGFVDGTEAGMRATLAEARAALGTAA